MSPGHPCCQTFPSWEALAVDVDTVGVVVAAVAAAAAAAAAAVAAAAAAVAVAAGPNLPSQPHTSSVILVVTILYSGVLCCDCCSVM